MVSINKTRRTENAKKKVTFSICTDKNDCYTKVPKDIQNALSQSEPKQLLNCAAKHDEYYNKQTVTHKKSGILVQPKKCAGKVCDVQKTLVRNVEQTIPPHCMLVKKKQSSVALDFNSAKEIPVTGAKSVYKSKYGAPELYTTLCIAKEIQTTSIKTETKHVDVPQAAKQILDEKILSKLNFPFEEKLYKGLVSLNVCEEELLGRNDKIGSRKEVEFRSKDPEPKLSDFFTPSEGKEYLVAANPLSPKPQRIRRYNGFTLYERSQRWNSVNN